MIRILHVFGCLDRGGAETMIMNHYRKLNRNEFQFDFVTHFQEEGAYENEILALGGRIFRVPRFKGCNLLGYVNAWKKLLKQHAQWSIIHVHLFTIAGIILPIAKQQGIKTRITHCHSSSTQINNILESFANFTLKKLANKYSTHRLSCSKEAGKYYFSNNEFQVLHNAIDIQKFTFCETKRTQKRKALNCSNKIVIGHIGRFNKVKNHEFIIDVFYELRCCLPDACLILAGTGPFEQDIRDKVDKLNLSTSVHFLGSRDDVSELMMAMDFFLFPSHYEGLGIVAIEAQASGLPTIISDGVPDEAMITPLAKKIPLTATAKEWAASVLDFAYQQERKNMFEEICSAGYNVDDNIKWLENFYNNEQ